MSFGTGISLLSDFTGADEDPLSEGGNWATIAGSSPLQRVSNQCGNTASTTGDAYWTPLSDSNVDVYATIPVKPALSGDGMSLAARVADVGSGAWDGYLAQFLVQSGTDIWLIQIVTNGTATTILSGTREFSTGDKIGMRCSGPLIGIYYDSGSGWTLLGETTDTTYTSGRVGLRIRGTTGRFDSFGAGPHDRLGNPTILGSTFTLNIGGGIEWVASAIAPASGTVHQISAYIAGQAGTNATLFQDIYADNGLGTAPAGRLAASAGVLITDSQPASWVADTITVDVVEGTRYWLGLRLTNVGGGSGVDIRSGAYGTERVGSIDNASNPATGYALISTNWSVSVFADIEETTVGHRRLYGPAQLGTAAATLYTAPTDIAVEIRRVWINNPSAETVKATLSIGADAGSTRVLELEDISAGEAYDGRRGVNHTLAAGETLQGYATLGDLEVLDDFNRADESPLASPWVKVATSGADDTLRLVSNAVTTTGAGNARRLYYYPGSVSSLNQYAQATQVTAPDDSNWSVAARIQADHTYYAVGAAVSTNGQIYKYVADTFTELASGIFDVDVVDGDNIGIEVEGSTIRALKNGVVEHELTDTSIATAGLGVGLAWWGPGGSVDDFAGGDLLAPVIVIDGYLEEV